MSTRFQDLKLRPACAWDWLSSGREGAFERGGGVPPYHPAFQAVLALSPGPNPQRERSWHWPPPSWYTSQHRALDIDRRGNSTLANYGTHDIIYWVDMFPFAVFCKLTILSSHQNCKPRPSVPPQVASKLESSVFCKAIPPSNVIRGSRPDPFPPKQK